MLKTVFIVDDDPISNLVSKTVLKKTDFAETFLTFENPEEAINQIQFSGPDLIFLDLMMPNMSGWDFLEALHDEGLSNQIRVVMLTASLKPEDEEKAKQYKNVLNIISKPLTQEFVNALKTRI